MTITSNLKKKIHPPPVESKKMLVPVSYIKHGQMTDFMKTMKKERQYSSMFRITLLG